MLQMPQKNYKKDASSESGTSILFDIAVQCCKDFDCSWI